MKKEYVAVGFKVDTSRSIFYFKETKLADFIGHLAVEITRKDPDFVSLRVVKHDT